MLTDFTAESVGARILKIGFFYRRVYDSRHLQADCQEPGSGRNPALGNRVLPLPFIIIIIHFISGSKAHKNTASEKTEIQIHIQNITVRKSVIMWTFLKLTDSVLYE